MVINLKKQFYLIFTIFILMLVALATTSAMEDQLDSLYKVRFKPFSSEISAAKIGVNIYNIVNTATSSVIIASDKCTNEPFLDILSTLKTERGLDIHVVIGDDQIDTSILWKDKYQLFTRHTIQKLENGGKMHNKFIVVDNKIVLTGSPNLTKPAYNSNIESFICIENQFIAQIYTAYYNYIINQTEENKTHVLTLMNSWNNYPDVNIQVCLAPIASISDFILERLNAANIVKLSMYLVGRATVPDTDIISNLSILGDKVTLKVDKKQYDLQEYVKSTLQLLADSGAHVFTVFKSKQKIFHDKLMLIEYNDGSKKIIIGSAGFTKSVQDNINFENMVSIDDDTTYNFLLSHFDSISSDRGFILNELQ